MERVRKEGAFQKKNKARDKEETPPQSTQGSFFRMNIISVDYYMTHPNASQDIVYSSFSGTAVSQVPVIRVWGSTPNNQKCLLHIHKALPYFYVKYDGSKTEGFSSSTHLYLKA